jgi:hypothetical protein
MARSVRECICTRQAGYPRDEFRLGAFPQVSHAMTGQDLFLVTVLALVLLAGLVVFPAIWSTKPARRRAALAVLERIIRWRW